MLLHSQRPCIWDNFREEADKEGMLCKPLLGCVADIHCSLESKLLLVLHLNQLRMRPHMAFFLQLSDNNMCFSHSHATFAVPC